MTCARRCFATSSAAEPGKIPPELKGSSYEAGKSRPATITAFTSRASDAAPQATLLQERHVTDKKQSGAAAPSENAPPDRCA